jgi:hypothetical protein
MADPEPEPEPELPTEVPAPTFTEGATAPAPAPEELKEIPVQDPAQAPSADDDVLFPDAREVHEKQKLV